MRIQSDNLALLVRAFAELPGIGYKSALRIALHMLRQPPGQADRFREALNAMSRICDCSVCHNIADTEMCGICNDVTRDRGLLCVVEGIQDIMAIEDTGQYRGLYHVLGGVISPIEGIGPGDLYVDHLLQRVRVEHYREVILAVNPTIDGETTMYYITSRLAGLDVKISQIARGVAFGGELQYTDEVTLGRSIMSRLPYTLSGQQ